VKIKKQGADIQELTLTEELTNDFIMGGAEKDAAQKAVRALFRYFGGQMLSVPSRKADSKTGEKIRRVIADATDDATAEKVLDKLMTFHGGKQLYFKLEQRACRKEIAREIYSRYRYGEEGSTMNDLAREYNISCAHAYRLWREGQRERASELQESQPLLGF
jgi:Mor family transcriptional regulator